MKNIDDTDFSICPLCSGSGEGYFEGSTCDKCKGRGVYLGDEYNQDLYDEALDEATRRN